MITLTKTSSLASYKLRPAGDIALSLSVSGNSPNCVKALEWAKKNGAPTVALCGAKRGRMAEVAEQVIVINDTHYGRVEDAHMGICHLLCYSIMEHARMGGFKGCGRSRIGSVTAGVRGQSSFFRVCVGGKK